MADIMPASTLQSRPIDRLYPVGVREGNPILVAVCTDHSIWQLDQRHVQPMWERLPAIPSADDE